MYLWVGARGAYLARGLFTRAEEFVITRVQVGHTKVTKANILYPGTRNTCHHCGQTQNIDYMLLECAVLQESCENTTQLTNWRVASRLEHMNTIRKYTASLKEWAMNGR